ncbi:MAG: N-carbamoylputrescine amidase [Alphaproteobacteria bacterium]|nr:N-carbamoylputrescine amidase [Alphaproteobacteria bacterium]MBU0795711.1 N-carbamoylputrescine amidase [Alphaproteobacteria bacterium]MBU0887334.1 N-carbamoylputrescine amidase [Alphaproteobacteria bacterium]MBU1811785.1 N-carbamoylputrescine amidase [Alphaproteobacteria bacterium]
MSEITLAATQMACSWDKAANVARAEALVREAAGRGANIILIQELFETPYFCVDQKLELFQLATPIAENETVKRMQALAAELGVVLPVSVFERANNAYFNSVALIDADGAILGVYRKSHIPDGPGYQEKYYFNPGDTGFKVFDTRFGKVGCAICWDQWFPESARAMALLGADFLFYPTAIGSEPQDSSLDSMEHWRITMRGHAAANMLPLVASNRIGREQGDAASITFYGSSFIASPKGQLVAEANRTDETILTASFDLNAIRAERAGWGFFRDRRPELYGPLLTLDGRTRR